MFSSVLPVYGIRCGGHSTAHGGGGDVYSLPRACCLVHFSLLYGSTSFRAPSARRDAVSIFTPFCALSNICDGFVQAFGFLGVTCLNFVPLCRFVCSKRVSSHLPPFLGTYRCFFSSGSLLHVRLRVYFYRSLCLLSAFRLFVLRFAFACSAWIFCHPSNVTLCFVSSRLLVLLGFPPPPSNVTLCLCFVFRTIFFHFPAL